MIEHPHSETVGPIEFDAASSIAVEPDRCAWPDVPRADQTLPPHPGHRAGAATAIELIEVSKRYVIGGQTVTALEEANLEIDVGEFAVVLGPSGSGKTTLLNMIGALDLPTSGVVRVAGQTITGASRRQLADFRRSSVSFVFQTFNLFPALTAFENVRFGADAVRREDSEAVAHEVLARVGLASRERHFAHELSGGEQQRVAIARALATGNPVLLADEPTGELDFRTGVAILELLREQSAEGRTVVIVTHNREISRVADRVIELGSGRIISDGAPAGGRAPIADLRW